MNLLNLFDFYEIEIIYDNDKSTTLIKEIDESSEKQVTNETNDNNIITEEDALINNKIWIARLENKLN